MIAYLDSEPVKSFYRMIMHWALVVPRGRVDNEDE